MNNPFGGSGGVRRYDAAVPRDPQTGLIAGAEPRELGTPLSPKALLFVHGFSGTPGDFHDLPDRVAAQGWFVKVMLLPGHGRSPFLFESTPADAMLAAVLEELRNLRAKHETVVLCGHSMGGALATLAAAQMELEGLILGAPYYAVTFKWFYLLHAEQWARLLSPVLRWIHVSPEQQPVKRKEVSSQILSYPWIPTRAFLSAMTLAADASRPETLERITCPTLLLHSTQDKVTDPGAAARAFALIGAAQRTAVWLDNSDHLIFWDYDRDQVARETISFLKSLK